jgi:hypothetical protein
LNTQSKLYSDIDNTDVYVINNYFKAWGHQLIHNIPSLSKLITNVGFCQISSFNVSKSDDLNLSNLEHHMNELGEAFNELETMILEAVKC